MLRFDSSYKVVIGDDLGSPTYWNSRLQDLDVRINSCEIYATTINSAVDEVIVQGLNRINTSFTPIVDGLVNQVNDLVSQVADLENTVVSDQNSVISQLNALLAQAQAIVGNIQTLGAVSGGTF